MSQEKYIGVDVHQATIVLIAFLSAATFTFLRTLRSISEDAGSNACELVIG
jgi:hypothetical protein